MVPRGGRQTTVRGRTKEGSGHGPITYPTVLPFEPESTVEPGNTFYVGLTWRGKLIVQFHTLIAPPAGSDFAAASQFPQPGSCMARHATTLFGKRAGKKGDFRSLLYDIALARHRVLS